MNCLVCNAELETVIDMSRVQAGVGGPRPTLVCPHRLEPWHEHLISGPETAIEELEREHPQLLADARRMVKLEVVAEAARRWVECYSSISSFTGKEHMARIKALKKALADLPAEEP